MQWQTHAAIGANAVWLVPLLSRVDEKTPLFLALGAFGALLPDIDAAQRGAKIHFIAGGVFGGMKGMARHRGFFHSFISICLVFCVSLPFGLWIDPMIPLVVTLGYASHLFIDQWNMGMQFFYPMRQYVTFVPSMLRFRVKSSGDMLFMMLGVFGIVAFVLKYLPVMMTTMNIDKLMIR